jgi:hypothetical protein
VIEREVHRLGVQHLAPMADIGHIAGREDRGDVAVLHRPGLQRDLAIQPVAARPRARKRHDHVVDAGLRHLLRALHGGADRALGLLHGVDLAEFHAARPGRGRADDAEPRLPRHRADPVAGADVGFVEFQNEARDLERADIEHGDHATAHRLFTLGPHGPLGLVKQVHPRSSPTGTRPARWRFSVSIASGVSCTVN